jgi:alginate O-acetyltransferase complex protein AlgI
MQVTSGTFILLVVIALAVYYRLPRRQQNIWLLLVSYAFCITWDWQFAAVMLVVTTVNYFAAKRLHSIHKNQKAVMWLVVGFNILTLAIFRLGNFFVPGFVTLLNGLGINTELGIIQILLPVGLSFYIVENISYQVDVYRRQTKPSDHFIDYALYQAYFPKLLAGPIERAGSFLPKLAQPRLVDNEVLARSITLVATGALRKLLIADTLTAMIPWDVFEAPANLGGLELWGWLLVYGFALYNDFAGYTSIVRGVSGLFGIELSLNFQTPYFARSFGEFWNSWHMTLSHWLRDYIYFPVLRARLKRNRSRTYPLNVVLPPLTTLLCWSADCGMASACICWCGARCMASTRLVNMPYRCAGQLCRQISGRAGGRQCRWGLFFCW